MPSTYTICEECHKVNRIEALDPQGKQGKTPICGHCQSKLPFKDGISELSATGLKKLIEKSPIPVVADFWASWCGPCRSFAPTFSTMAKKRAGEVAFVKVNTEAHPLAGDYYSIRGIPTVLKFNGGREVARQSGAMPEPVFNDWLGQG